MIDFGSYNTYKEYWANHFKNRVDFEIYPKKTTASLHLSPHDDV